MLQDETQLSTQTFPIQIDSKSLIKPSSTIKGSPEKFLSKLKSWVSKPILQFTLFELLFKNDLITTNLLNLIDTKTCLNLQLVCLCIKLDIQNSSYWIQRHEMILKSPPLSKHTSWMHTFHINVKSNKNWMNLNFNLSIKSIIPLRDSITGHRVYTYSKPQFKDNFVLKNAFNTIHTAPIISYAHSETMNLIATADQLGVICIYNHHGALLSSLELDAGVACMIVIDSKIYLGLYDGKVITLRVSESVKIKTGIERLSPKKRQYEMKLIKESECQVHAHEIYCLVEWNGWIISGCGDGNISMTKETKHDFRTHSNAVTCLVVIGNFLYSGSLDGCIMKWDLNSKTFIKLVGQHQMGIKSLCLNSKFLISGGWDDYLCVWDQNEDVLVSRIDLPGPISHIACDEYNLIVSSYQQGMQHQIILLSFYSSVVNNCILE